MATTENQKLEKRRTILRAARRCFVRHGFHATGMAEICQVAGMSAGNLYRYFPNKAAIIEAIVDETRARIVPVYERLQAHEDPIEGIVEIIQHSVKEFCRGSDGRLWIDVLAEASRNEVVRELCMTFDREIRASLKTLLLRVNGPEGASPRVDVEAASVWLAALLDGAIARVAVDRKVDLARTMGALASSIRRCLSPQAS